MDLLKPVERRLFLNDLFLFLTIFFIFNVNRHLAVSFIKLAGFGSMWVISISFVYTELLAWAFSQSHRLNLTYHLKSSLLLAFFLWLVCMVDQTQICPPTISPLFLFQQIICNMRDLKGDLGVLNRLGDLN